MNEVVYIRTSNPLCFVRVQRKGFTYKDPITLWHGKIRDDRFCIVNTLNTATMREARAVARAAKLKLHQPGLVAVDLSVADAGRKGGSAISPAKAEASRANGRKGGRPRKPDVDWYDQAAARVNRSPVLKPHADFILNGGWITPGHLRWVAHAGIREIASWVGASKTTDLDQVE